MCHSRLGLPPVLPPVYDQMSKYISRRRLIAVQSYQTSQRNSSSLANGDEVTGGRQRRRAQPFPYTISVLFPYQLTHETRYQVILHISSPLRLIRIDLLRARYANRVMIQSKKKKNKKRAPRDNQSAEWKNDQERRRRRRGAFELD